MSEHFEKYLCEFFQGHVSTFKKYLLAALDSPDGHIWYIESSRGTPVPSVDIWNCDFLVAANLFKEDYKISRDGHNRYKSYYLTATGKEMAQKMKEECSRGDVLEGCP
jgi:hypothetical protein